MNKALKKITKKTAFLFPGQGSQKIGMGKDLFEKYKVARSIFDEMDSVLGVKLSEIMMNGDNEVLSRSEYSQPAILACSYAMFKIYQEKSGFKFNREKDVDRFITIGHSLGEFSALTVTDMIEFQDAIEIVNKRGMAMQECLKMKQKDGIETSMIALIGEIGVDNINNFINQNDMKDGKDIVEIANINSSQQVVLSGYKHSITKLIDILKHEKYKFKSIPLNVQLPFHCKLLNPVCNVMKGILDTKDQHWKFLDPIIPILMNLDCKPYYEVQGIKDNLVIQTIKPVDFHGCLKESEKMGFSDFIEVGFGSTLSSLVTRNLSNVNIGHITELE